MIYSWLSSQYDPREFGLDRSVVCLGPVIIKGDPRRVTIAPGVVLGHPAKQVLVDHLNSIRGSHTYGYLNDRRPVVISEGCVIGPFSVVYEGASIAENVFIEGRSIVRSNGIIGCNTTVYFGAYIGDDVRIGEHCKIAGFLCNRSVVGDRSAVLGKLVHKYARPCIQAKEASPIIGTDVLVGINAIVIGDVTVSDHARVGAGAIVLKDVQTSITVTGVYR